MATMDTRLPLLAQTPDPIGSLVRGVSAAESVNQIRRNRALRDLFSEQGAGIMRGETGALEALASFDPESARGIQRGIADERRAADRHKMAQGNYQRNVAAHNLALEEQQFERAISIMQSAQTPQQWDALAAQHDPDLVGQFEQKDALINQAIGLKEALARTKSQQAAQEVDSYFGGVDEFNQGLSTTESGGNYGVVNDEGFGGKYQFGQARLDDFNRANGTNYTVADLTRNPDSPETQALQEAVQGWHVGDIDSFIRGNGLDQYIGQNVGGTTMTVNGMRAMAHLGGKGGLKRYLETGGKYNPADSNGTSLSDYAKTHAGGGGQSDSTRLVKLLQNPDVASTVKNLAVAEYERSQPIPSDPSKRYMVIDGVLVDMEADGGPSAVDVRGIDLGENISFDDEQKLRKEWTSLPAVKDFSSQVDAYGRIIASAEDPSAAGDLAMIFNYMKLLDPGSVVRESEFATAEQATAWLQEMEEGGSTVPAPIARGIRKMETGQKLAPAQRKDFVDRARRLYDEAESGYTRLEEQYVDVAQASGFNPDRTIMDFRRAQQKAGEAINIDGYTIEALD